MKKELRIIALFAVFILLFSLLPFIRAQDAATAGSTPETSPEPDNTEASPTLEEYGEMTPGEQIEQTVGFNPEKVPKTPQETRDYLQQEWTKIVVSKPVIGKIHSFFVAHPLIFKIFFNYPYEFSLTFFIILFLWVFIMVAMASLLSKSELLNGPASWAIGVGASVVLAHTGVFKALSIFMSNLALARETWLMRTIIWVILLTIWIVLMYIDWAIAEKLKEMKKEKAAQKTAEEAEQAGKKIEALEKGMKFSPNPKKKLVTAINAPVDEVIRVTTTAAAQVTHSCLNMGTNLRRVCISTAKHARITIITISRLKLMLSPDFSPNAILAKICRFSGITTSFSRSLS
ncbi:MAG: hypothetical protein MUF61_03020 [archaeon]|nr:hypothetical protein [archaeon]